MWDGKDSDGETMPPGTYKFEAQASIDGETKGLYTLLPANVDSVTLGQGGGELMLNLAGLGSIPLISSSYNWSVILANCQLSDDRQGEQHVI